MDGGCRTACGAGKNATDLWPFAKNRADTSYVALRDLAKPGPVIPSDRPRLLCGYPCKHRFELYAYSTWRAVCTLTVPCAPQPRTAGCFQHRCIQGGQNGAGNRCRERCG